MNDYQYGRVDGLNRRNTMAGAAMLLMTAFVALIWFTTSGENVVMRIVGAALAFASIAGAAMPPSKVMHADARGTAFGKRIAQVVLMWFVGTFRASSLEMDGRSSSGSLATLTLLWALVMVICLVIRRRAVTQLPRAQVNDDIATQRAREEAYEDDILRAKNRLQEPSGPGRMTGFEPAALASWQLRKNPHMYGDPGAGLAGSGFSSSAVAKGQLGEVNFAKALDRQGLLGKVASFWSVQMPSEQLGAHETFSTDIDCVLVTDTTVYLLDMKNYTQGDVTWVQARDELRLIDNATGHDVGRPRLMSQNMKMAQEIVAGRLARLGLNHQVAARVIFMPTDAGTGIISSAIRWPGNVPAVSLEAFLAELSAQPGFNPSRPDAEYVLRLFRVLVKDESGSAPSRSGTPTRPMHTTTGSGSTSGSTAATAAAPTSPAAPTAPEAPTQAVETQTATQPVSTEKVEPQTPAEPAVPRCRECQAELAEGADFCYRCGASA